MRPLVQAPLIVGAQRLTASKVEEQAFHHQTVKQMLCAQRLAASTGLQGVQPLIPKVLNALRHQRLKNQHQ